MKRKIVFIVNHAAFFCSHRLNLAIDIVKHGWDFHLIIGQPASIEMEKYAIKILKKNKINYTRTSFQSNFSLNLFKEIYGMYQIKKKLKKINPDLVHLVSPKAILFGGIVSRLLKVKNIVIAISGLGSLVTFNRSFKSYILNKIYFIFLKFISLNKYKKIIVQNLSDKKIIMSKLKNLKPKDFVLIPGSGEDPKKFKLVDYKKSKNIVLMSSRILIDKGVIEYLKASEILKKKFPHWKFLIAGSLDYKSSAAINSTTFKNYLKKKYVIWLGYEKNIIKLLKITSIACLPSYREGMSKFLIEASFLGKPIVTTNVPGCRDVVINNKTGVLVKPRNYMSLAKGIEKLIKNYKLREKYSKRANEFAIDKFNSVKVVGKTLKIYKEMLNEK